MSKPAKDPDKPVTDRSDKLDIDHPAGSSKIEALGRIFDWLGAEPSKNIDLIVNQACAILGGVCSIYNRLDREKHLLVVRAGCNLPVDFNSADAPEGHLCFEAVIKSGQQPVAIEELENTVFTDTDPNVRRYGLKSYLGCAVSLGDRIVGSLCIVDNSVRRFSTAEKHIIKTLAKALSLEEDRLVVVERLRESELRYRSIFENSHTVMLLIDPDSADIVDANPAACAYYGYSRKALSRMRISEINTMGKQKVYEEMQRARREQRKYFLFRHRLADGEVRDVEVYSGPITVDGKALLLSVIHDISERKKTELALQVSEGLLSDVFESIQDGISILEPDLRIRRTNRVMAKWYHDSLPLEGKKCYACYHHRDEPCTICPTLRCMQTGKTEREVVPGPQGSPVEWIELYSYPIKDRRTGNITGVVEFVRDITEQKRLETQLRQAERMESIGTLAGGIAHDFNNLLMGIQGRISLMMMEADTNGFMAENLRETETIVRRAAELTSQILGFARGGKYEVRPTDMNDLLEQSLRMFARTSKEIAIHKKFEKDLWTVAADRVQIEQVLLNIYVNAWQAMPGGGRIYLQTANTVLEEPAVRPHGLEAGKYVKVSITDTGLGMDKEIQKRVFDPFFTTKDKERGTGLGLASAYGIVKNHGGFILLESRPGEGATFHVHLPAVDAPVPRGLGLMPHVDRGEETVLLVDDEDFVRDVGRSMLERIGYRVLTASGGKEALERFEEHREQIDLVILDLVMPEMDGGAVFDRLREMDAGVKVLLSSGYSLSGQAAEILKRGCNGFIQKPFDLRTLSQKLREVIEPGGREH